MSKRVTTISRMVLMLILFSMQVLQLKAQPAGVPIGGCKEWRNGGWVEVPCATSSGGGGTPSNNTRYTRKQQRLDEKQQRLNEAYEANEQGVKYWGDWEKAIPFFEEAVRKDPDDSIMRDNLRRAKEQLRLQQQEQLRIQQQQQLEQQNNAAVLKMQQSVQAFTQTLNTVPSTGGLNFDGNNSTISANKNGNSSSLQFGDPNIVDAHNVLPSGLPKAIDDAIAGAYKNAPPGVSEKVNKGFQAVMIKDWKVAKACFQDALLHDPGNEGLQKFIDLCDYTPGNTPSQAEIDKFFINFNAGTYQNPPDDVRNYIRSMSSENFKKELEKHSLQKVVNANAPSQAEIDEFFIKFNAGTSQDPPDYVRNYIRLMPIEEFKKLLEKHSPQKLPIPAGTTYVPTSDEINAYLENVRYRENPFTDIPNSPGTFSQKFRIYINSLNPEEYKRFLNIQLPQKEDMEFLFDVTIPPVKPKTNTPG